MSDDKVIKSKSYIQSDLDRPELYSFAQGTIGLYTHRAPQKETPNEDALALIPVDNKTGVLVVADGVGGMPKIRVGARPVKRREG